MTESDDSDIWIGCWSAILMEPTFDSFVKILDIINVTQKELVMFRAVYVTVPNIEVAKKIAHGLVSNKLAACVNIMPQVTSVYEWEGKINEDSELILMIKSKDSLFSELEKFVKENHPYSVPAIVALPIEKGSQSYLDWINEVTKK